MPVHDKRERPASQIVWHVHAKTSRLKRRQKGNALKTHITMGIVHRAIPQAARLRERSPCSRVREICRFHLENKSYTLFARNLNKITEKRLLRFARNDIKMDVLHQAKALRGGV